MDPAIADFLLEILGSQGVAVRLHDTASLKTAVAAREFLERAASKGKKPVVTNGANKADAKAT